MTDLDDRLWAAVELFVTTKEERFQHYIRSQIPNFSFTLFEWKDPSPLALLTYHRETKSRSVGHRSRKHIQV